MSKRGRGQIQLHSSSVSPIFKSLILLLLLPVTITTAGCTSGNRTSNSCSLSKPDRLLLRWYLRQMATEEVDPDQTLKGLELTFSSWDDWEGDAEDRVNRWMHVIDRETGYSGSSDRKVEAEVKVVESLVYLFNFCFT